jgi:hypothetical protein
MWNFKALRNVNDRPWLSRCGLGAESRYYQEYTSGFAWCPSFPAFGSN